MDGITGATSGKFILMAATLLFHGRVDNARSTIAIVPGAPHSAISETLAKRVRQGAPVKIGIRGEYLRASIAGVEHDPGQGADVRIGQDILDANPIEIDFAHHQLRLLLAGDAKRAEHGMTAISVSRQPDGTMTVPLKLDDAAPIVAVLNLASATGIVAANASAKSVALWSVVLKTADVSGGTAPSVGLGTFAKTRVIFDFGHDRIWVAT